LGASPADMGWFRSLQNLSGNTMQLVGGLAMDKIGRPVLFVVLGSLLGGLLWFPYLFVSTPQQITVLAVVQLLLMSMAGPGSISVNDRLVSKSRRSQGVAEFHVAWMVGTIPAALVAGFLMSRVRDGLAAMYFLPIVLAGLFRAGSALLLWPMMRRERRGAVRSTGSSIGNIGSVVQNPSLRMLYSISFFQGFFMSAAWPLFPIANVVVTGNDMFLIAMLSIVNTVVSSLTRPYFGRLADRFGKKPVLILGRVGIALVPLSYAFATEFWHLVVGHVLTGIFMMAESVTQAYILENTRRESVATSLAFYSMVYGVATFFGSLVGGYLVNGLLILGYSQARALTIGFLFSAVGRAVTGVSYGKLKED
jgi:MFS family permease